MKKLIHYFDYKSPYAYLAQDALWELSEQIEIITLPYTLQIPKYLGAAELDEQGADVLQTRNDHQWRRVRYAYMDCRREANRRGLTVRGPRKIFDSSLAHIAFLYAQDQRDFRAFHDAVYERFWRRELDIEDVEVLSRLLDECGYDGADFAAYAASAGRARHDRIQQEAEDAGVFGVPSYLIDEQLFWGLERLERAKELIR
ncbi:MAG: DsbA family protein [Pseudomonadota bacterium]